MPGTHSAVLTLLVWVQVLQAGFVDKTAQLQALQASITGCRTPDPDIVALQHDMHEAQVRLAMYVLQL